MIVQIKALDGSIVEFDDSKIIGKGEMKDVYFSPDRSYVVAFYRNSSKDQTELLDRLETIVGPYRESIFNNEGGNYWEPLYCWPTKVLIHNNKIGLVSPTYRNCFFFKHGSQDNDSGGIRGKEKEGKWFSSIRNQHFLDPRERGDWKGYVIACQKIAQAVKRLNAAGLAHSDLSYKNVLIDPPTGQISIIDLDGLVVTGKFNPEVMGTADFIAPEVIATQHLSLNDPNRVLPSIDTDCHALATLIYMYLLNRHPLRGGKVYDLDPDEDEELIMGERALFIEHPTNPENRVNVNDLYPAEKECGDPSKTPYTLCGAFLKPLFERAFINGLHNPKLRPRADEWATALTNTYELLVPCSNMICEHSWFVYDRGITECPFCHTRVKDPLPVFYFYRQMSVDEYVLTSTRFVGFNGKKLSKWLLDAERRPLEFTSAEDLASIGYISFEEGEWFINNTGADYMVDALYLNEVKKRDRYKLTESCCISFTRDMSVLITVHFDHEVPIRNTIRTKEGEGNRNYLYIHSESSNNRMKASVNRLKSEHPRFYNKYKFLFDQDEIIFPDGIINREYNLDLKAIFPADCSLQFVGLDAFGLYYSKSSSSIRGFPSQVGDISILINVKLPIDMIKLTKNAKLTINVPDAKETRMDESESSDGMAQLPNANLEQTYRVNFNDIFKDIEIENVIGHDTLGLSYNNHTKILSGVPNQKGRFMLKIRYRSKGLGGSKLLLLSRNVILKVDSAVQITWNDIPTPRNIRFYKPDVFSSVKTLYVNESQTSSKTSFMCSIRGRLHANNGLPRNSDCAIENLYGWVLIAMSDGSDKAEFSREGSRLAVNAILKSLLTSIDRSGSSIDNVVHELAALEQNSKNQIMRNGKRLPLERMICDAFKNAYSEVSIQANFADLTADLVDTNLGIWLIKRFDFGWFVLSASVGRFVSAICTSNYDILPLGFNDYGDYIFRDGTIMEPRYVEEKEIRRRIDYKIVDSLVMVMMMNRALSREIFSSMTSIRGEDRWTEWLADLATNVDLRSKDCNKTVQQLEEYVSGKLMGKDNNDKSIIIMK